MTEVNGQPVMDMSMTADHGGTYGSFTVPGPGVGNKAWNHYRPGDRIVITGHGSPIAATVRSIRWSPTVTEVEWMHPRGSELVESASDIIDAAARELAARHPA